MIENNFQNSYWSLLNSDEFKLDLEDDVGLELFFDHLKLHKLYLENLNINGSAKNHVGSKYLRKLLKTLTQWELRLESNMEMSEYIM